jgi:hypothetical protein
MTAAAALHDFSIMFLSPIFLKRLAQKMSAVPSMLKQHHERVNKFL